MNPGGDTRTRIKEAALRLFVEKGVALTTTRDLAREAGIAEGTLYRHFPGKDELVRDLFQEHYTGLAHRIEAVQAAGTGIAAKLRAIVLDLAALFDQNPTLYRFLLLVQHEALPGIPQDGGAASVLRTMFAQAAAAGELRLADPDLAAALFLGMMLQPALSIIHDGLAQPLSHHAEAIAASCQRALAKNQTGGGIPE